MDNLTETKNDITKEESQEGAAEEITVKKKRGIFARIGSLFSSAEEARHGDKRALIFDLCIFTLALFFARCHVLFSSRPLGIAFIAILPVGVPVATLGAIVGSLSLGRGGVIYAVISLIVAFIRVIISGGDKEEGRALFSENLLLRMSSAVIGGFVAAVYEVLLSGLSETSLLFGLSMILLPPAVTFGFSGLFSSGITVTELISGTGNLFSLSGKREKEKFNLIFFQGSALIFLFFATLALSEIDIFGISASYIFVCLVTLLVAKRFGALRALAVGFFSSLGISGVYAVSFALAGLGAGILFSFGTAYALILGGVALSAWSAYSSGLEGFLTTLPEYLIAATLSVPLLKNITAERTESEAKEVGGLAEDMVGATALAYRNKYSKNLDSLESALGSLAKIISERTDTSTVISTEEYKDIVLDISEDFCRNCSGADLCQREKISPTEKNVDNITKKLGEKKKILPEDVNTDTEFCQNSERLADEINRRVAELESENYKQRQRESTAEDYEMIARLVNEARVTDNAERTLDSNLSKRLSEILPKFGFADGSIRVFGDREKHFILAGEDEDGDKITAKELREEIENIAGVRLAVPEYFRRGRMVLMECDTLPKYSLKVATASTKRRESGVSGDTTTAFSTENGYFYAAISDGMGSGERAKEASLFVTEYLEKILGFGASKDTVMYMLNHSLRRQRAECSASVDLFEFDLYSADATFVKSGAAPSYIKRNSSIFRIRSQTAPIGLMRSIDSEKIRVEIKDGDYIIMLSDGIFQTADEAPWLLEALAGAPKRVLGDYAEYILDLAKKNTKGYDDMTVMVLKVSTL